MFQSNIYHSVRQYTHSIKDGRSNITSSGPISALSIIQRSDELKDLKEEITVIGRRDKATGENAYRRSNKDEIRDQTKLQINEPFFQRKVTGLIESNIYAVARFNL